MKFQSILLCLIIFLAGCSNVKLVKEKGNYDQFKGSCKITEQDLIKLPKPFFPLEAVKNGQSGWVALKFDIKNGIPENIQVIDSSPKGIFEESAVTRLSKTLYKSSLSESGCVSIGNYNVN